MFVCVLGLVWNTGLHSGGFRRVSFWRMWWFLPWCSQITRTICIHYSCNELVNFINRDFLDTTKIIRIVPTTEIIFS
jgi:hypothetical protein